MACRSTASGLLLIFLLAVAPAEARGAGGKTERKTEGSWYAGKLDFETGADYRTGDYGGSDDTEIFFVPFSIRYRFQNLAWSKRDEIRVRVTVPYLNVKGTERGDAAPGNTGTDNGIGDVNVRLTYGYQPRPAWIPDVYLSERVKFPTASESKRLGTGEFDFTTDVMLLKRIAVRRSWPFRYVKPWVMGGYKVAGESSAQDRDNAWRAGAGTTLQILDSFDLGVGYAFRDSTLPGAGDSQVISPYANYRVTRWLQLSPYGTFGVSSRSQDWGAGLLIRLTQSIE